MSGIIAWLGTEFDEWRWGVGVGEGSKEDGRRNFSDLLKP